MCAHLYKISGGWELLYTDGAALSPVLLRIKVSGKREARKLAKLRGAICWNF